jgi:hypothetical protein
MMAKYSKFERKTPQARYKIHPIWAGIGFLMIIIVPIMAWAGATEAVKFAWAQSWPFMRTFPVYLPLPDLLNIIPGIGFITGIANLPALATFFVIILVILTGILSFAYAAVYRIVGPPRYSSQDEPAPRIKTKKYKR